MLNAQKAGAIGVIVADNEDNPLIKGMPPVLAPEVTIPSLFITRADGNKLRTTIPGLAVRLHRELIRNMDGALDNAIVAHEWGHYISNRLIWKTAGLTNNQGAAMGEGWGDFHALLMMTRAEDINVPSNANWNGACSVGEYAVRSISKDSTFFSLRRVAYSADMTKNALTFRHISNGETLPDTAPIYPARANAQLHNSGEIWATMLWECYVSLLRAYPFQQAQQRMKQYLVNGYHALTRPHRLGPDEMAQVVRLVRAPNAEFGSKSWRCRSSLNKGGAATDWKPVLSPPRLT